MPPKTLKFSSLQFVLLIMVGVLMLSCSSDDNELTVSETTIIEVVEYSSTELQILDLVNKHRTSKGLKTLEDLGIISSVAKSHSQYMKATGSVNHDNFGERQEVLRSKASAQIVGENVGYGYSTAKGVVQAWLESEGHKKIIENEYYTHFGVSIEKDSKGRNYFTQIFIKR